MNSSTVLVWLVLLFFLTACTDHLQPVATSQPEPMVTIPVGWFLMGQDDGPQSNRPQRAVYLDAFTIDQTEVTNAAFARFVAETDYQAKGWDGELLEEHANEPVVGVVWHDAESDFGRVLPVGSYPSGASPYGALDMAGNVAEWVADYFDSRYYTYAPDRNPKGPRIVVDHVLRGGSWASPPEHAQTFFRDSSHSVRPNPRVGFRCAQTLLGEPGNP
ncbi:MAG: formylglycine-generating enzyme family protein [Anaerolineae bacterium]